MLNWMWVGIGHLCVVLGVIGIFLPLLPTTPFLLLAAFLYAKGSRKFHDWLVSHPKLGPPIHAWKQTGSIAPGAKKMATAFILLNALVPWFIRGIPLAAKVMSAFVLACVLVFIWTRPD